MERKMKPTALFHTLQCATSAEIKDFHKPSNVMLGIVYCTRLPFDDGFALPTNTCEVRAIPVQQAS